MEQEKVITGQMHSVKAIVRRSRKENGKDAWLTIELGAERAVNNYEPSEDIVEVAMLAEELDEELRKLMIDSGRQEDGEVTVCPEHGEEYKRYEKNGSAWWSHQIPGGGWCKRGF